jgi:L-ascorbate metabolism protein UlaG (beta-lactamase superfamily)
MQALQPEGSRRHPFDNDMDAPPSRSFRIKKLRFIFNLVVESLFCPMRGEQHQPLRPGPAESAITWIGHSSFLVEVGGQSILIDPVFSRYLIVLKRRRRPGIRVRDLPPIDLILLTHAHMDHLDLASLRRVVRNNRRLGVPAPVVCVPRGVEDLVQPLGFREIRSLAVWEPTELGSLTITLTPARHWGARRFNDIWRGYGGYVVASGHESIYHCGDSAQFPGFAEIGARLAPRIALLPIGAYSPENFRSVHTSPEDAFAAFRDLGSEVMIPMHYGTFRLSLEPMDEPPLRLKAAAAEAGAAERVLYLEEGCTYRFMQPEARNAQA